MSFFLHNQTMKSKVIKHLKKVNMHLKDVKESDGTLTLKDLPFLALMFSLFKISIKSN